MPGVIEKQLSTTVVADNTAMTPANSGFSTVNAASPSTAVVLAAAAMNEAVGYRFVQSGAFQTYAHLDWNAARTNPTLRIPFRYSATPAANTSWIRFYAEVAHSTNLGTLSITTGNLLQFFEGAASGTPLNVTSPAGFPMVPGNDYVLMAKIDTTAQTFAAQVFPRGSTTALFTISGNLSGSMPAVAGLRYGIFTASAIPQVDTNSAFAIGTGDYLARSDIAASPLAATATVTPSDHTVGTTQTLTITATGGNVNAKSYAATTPAGAQLGPQAGNTFTYQDATPGSKTVNWSVTQAD